MRYLSLLLFLTLTACAQLMHGEIQPVIVKDASQKIMYTTCGGVVEDWASCNRKASQACSGSYSELKKVEDNNSRRELTFQCNQ